MLVSKVPGRWLPAEGWGLGCLAADIRSGLRRNVLLGVRLVVVVHPLMVVGDRDAGLTLGGARRRGNNRQRNNSSQKLQHCISFRNDLVMKPSCAMMPDRRPRRAPVADQAGQRLELSAHFSALSVSFITFAKDHFRK
jgi:hypothetical protein